MGIVLNDKLELSFMSRCGYQTALRDRNPNVYRGSARWGPLTHYGENRAADTSSPPSFI